MSSFTEKTESLLRLADNISDTSSEENLNTSFGVSSLRNDVEEVKKQNAETNKFLEMYKARENLEQNHGAYMDNSEIQERIDKIQKQMNDLEEEKQRLEN